MRTHPAASTASAAAPPPSSEPGVLAAPGDDAADDRSSPSTSLASAAAAATAAAAAAAAWAFASPVPAFPATTLTWAGTSVRLGATWAPRGGGDSKAGLLGEPGAGAAVAGAATCSAGGRRLVVSIRAERARAHLCNCHDL
jgi:hypothetical protein